MGSHIRAERDMYINFIIGRCPFKRPDKEITMGKLFTAFFIITLLFTACANTDIGKDLPDNGAKTEPNAVLYFEDEKKLALDEVAAVQGVIDNLFLYTQADAENNTQTFFSYDLLTEEKREIGTVENFVMSTNPLKYGVHERQLYFYMRTAQNNQEVTGLYELNLEEDNVNIFEQDNISGKLSYIATLNENVILSLKSNSSNFKNSEISYVEAYDFTNKKKKRIIQKEMNPNSLKGEKIWAITAKNQFIYLFVVDYDHDSWKIEVHDEKGKLIKEYDCNDSKSFFFSDWVANIEVYGDYVIISSINDVSIYQMTDENIRLVAFASGASGNIDSFYGAANLSDSRDDLVVLSSRGKNFFLLDTVQEKLYVSPCMNLEDGTEEHIFQVAQNGPNIVYATFDPISKRRNYYYTNLDVLLDHQSSVIDLSGEAVNISAEASYPVPANGER